MRNFLFLFAFFTLFLGCKKDEVAPVTTVELTPLSAKWGQGSSKYTFTFTPTIQWSGESPSTDVGYVHHTYKGTNPVPGLPDPTWRETGHIVLKSATQTDSTLFLKGVFDYDEKKLLVNGAETIGTPRPEDFQLLYDYNTDVLRINAGEYGRE